MELRQASSLDDARRRACRSHGGTEVVPLLRDGLLQADALVDIRGVVPRGIDGRRASARARRSPSSSAIRRSRTRCARRAGSRRARSCATWARSPATCSRRRAAGTGGSNWPCRLHGGDECFAHEGEHREHAIFANDFCASAHPSDVAAALLALDATLRTEPARAAARRALPPADRGRPPHDDARAGRADPRGRASPTVESSRLPEGDGAEALGVPARRRRRRAPRRRDARRARRRRADPVAARGRARRRDAAAAERVQGRRRARARPARAKRRSVRADVERRRRMALRRGLPLRARARARRLRRRRARRHSTRRRRRRRDAERLHDRSSTPKPAAAQGGEADDGARPVEDLRRHVQTNCGSFTIRLDVKTVADDDRVVRQPRAEGLLRRHDLPPHRPRLRHPGRRPDRAPASAAPATRPSTSRPPTTRYTLGIVAMAKTQAEPAGTSGSQFFVVTGAGRAAAAGLRDARQGRRRARHGRRRSASSAIRRPSSRPRSSRSRRRPSPVAVTVAAVVLAAGAATRYGGAEAARVPPGRARRAGGAPLAEVVVVEGAHPLRVDSTRARRRALRRLGDGPGRLAALRPRGARRATSSTRSSCSRTAPSSTRGRSSA